MHAQCNYSCYYYPEQTDSYIIIYSVRPFAILAIADSTDRCNVFQQPHATSKLTAASCNCVCSLSSSSWDAADMGSDVTLASRQNRSRTESGCGSWLQVSQPVQTLALRQSQYGTFCWSLRSGDSDVSDKLHSGLDVKRSIINRWLMQTSMFMIGSIVQNSRRGIAGCTAAHAASFTSCTRTVATYRRICFSIQTECANMHVCWLQFI
jgi:hypothetical protein